MADQPQIQLPAKLPGLTYRESRYVRARLEGKSRREAMLAAGFSHWQAKCPQQIETPEMLATVEKLQAELARHTLEAGLVDAAEIHEYLTDALRADIRDIRNEDGSFRPQSEWPEIWGRMCEAGDVEVSLSDDGQQVKRVKLKFTPKSKLLELAMRHKGVNALAEEQSARPVSINIVLEGSDLPEWAPRQVGSGSTSDAE